MTPVRIAITASRYHDFSCGHRVFGHESKCAHLHGHNYRVHFQVKGDDGLDAVGRVLDFSAIKHRLCDWLEQYWDHKFLVWEFDPLAPALQQLDPAGVVLVSFNPTAENMAQYLLDISLQLLDGTFCRLVGVVVEETRKCSAAATVAP